MKNLLTFIFVAATITTFVALTVANKHTIYRINVIETELATTTPNALFGQFAFDCLNEGKCVYDVVLEYQKILYTQQQEANQ